MLLAIDIGNSNIVIGCYEEKTLLRVFRMVTDAFKTEDEYAAQIKLILDSNGLMTRDIGGAMISSVVPRLTNTFREAARILKAKTTIIVGAGIKTGLNIQIDNPAELGSDMVASAVAALEKYGAPVIIVDMGTATKISVLSREGVFIGGAICPGVALSADALASGASLLPRVSIEAPKKAVSTGTIDCMKSGIVFGAASMIDGMLQRFAEEQGYTSTVVATGGIASRIAPHCREKVVFDPNLIIDGLRILYTKNRKTAPS